MGVPVMRTGLRTIGGHRYSFMNYKRTKVAARKWADEWRKSRKDRRNDSIRVLKGRDYQGKVTYGLWIREKK